MTAAVDTAEWERVAGMVFGFFPAQVVQTVARLGVPDALGTGSLDLYALATRTGSQPDALARLLRAAAGLGLVSRNPDGAYALTPGGHLLRAGRPDSIGNLAQLFCGDVVWRSWGELEWSVRTGEQSFEKLTGRSAFAYMADDPELNAVFTEAMAEGTRRAAPGVVAAFDLTGVTTLLDAHPHLRGILFDTPSGATATVVGERCEVVTGDFFEAVPAADAYVVKSVIHDWDDERSVAILSRVREAMPAHGVLFLVEPILRDEPEALADQRILLMSDLNMLVCTGGRERTEAEFGALLDAAGLRLTSVTPTEGSGYSVMRAEPA